ncbi:MAG: TAXI family TRAP transporter solute-binding subunit [Deltaproteobacteria bacterium]|nr:TAXI family TRAP transporter solute-binding subunit [Deltaproteobacteria bacterium]
MRRRWFALVLLALLAALGCQKGPGRDALHQEIQSKLDRHFGEGAFQIDELIRRGSQPYQEKGDERERLLIYFNAEIRFQKDYKLSNWDQLNVGSLVSVLGATPLGIDGVKPEGNRAGDVLSVHGTSAYAMGSGGWEPIVYVGEEDQQKKPREGAEDPPAYKLRMEEIAKLGKQFQRRNRDAELDLLEAELDEVLAASQRRLARSRGWITIASGTPSGEYYALGEALEDLLDKRKRRTEAVATSGSAENCQLVQSGEVLFGFSQNDIAHMAHHGTGLFERNVPLSDLRALGSLYPEAVQIVTLKGSNITTMDDLRGKRINIGVEGSGMRINAIQVLKAADIDLAELAEVRGTPRAAAVQELKAGKIDALFVTSAYPAAAVLKLAVSHPVRLIPLDQATIVELRKRYPFLIPIRIPRNTYPDMEQDGLTVGVTAMMIARSDAPDERVELLLDTLFSELDQLSRSVLPAYYVSADKALSGVSIPMHPAARRYFERR